MQQYKLVFSTNTICTLLVFFFRPENTHNTNDQSNLHLSAHHAQENKNVQAKANLKNNSCCTVGRGRKQFVYDRYSFFFMLAGAPRNSGCYDRSEPQLGISCCVHPHDRSGYNRKQPLDGSICFRAGPNKRTYQPKQMLIKTSLQ